MPVLCTNFIHVFLSVTVNHFTLDGPASLLLTQPSPGQTEAQRTSLSSPVLPCPLVFNPVTAERQDRAGTEGCESTILLPRVPIPLPQSSQTGCLKKKKAM